jgi:hypothetical protein
MRNLKVVDELLMRQPEADIKRMTGEHQTGPSSTQTGTKTEPVLTCFSVSVSLLRASRICLHRENNDLRHPDPPLKRNVNEED